MGSHQSGYLKVVVLPPLRDFAVEIRLDIDGNRRQARLSVDPNQVFQMRKLRLTGGSAGEEEIDQDGLIGKISERFLLTFRRGKVEGREGLGPLPQKPAHLLERLLLRMA